MIIHDSFADKISSAHSMDEIVIPFAVVEWCDNNDSWEDENGNTITVSDGPPYLSIIAACASRNEAEQIAQQHEGSDVWENHQTYAYELRN